MSVIATSIVLLAGPWLAGVAVGRMFILVLGRRATGLVSFAGCLLLPPAMCLFAVSRAPVVGIWDALVEGALFGFGLVVSVHSEFRDRRVVVLAALGLILGLATVELASRVALPSAPTIGRGRVPHLFLRDALREDGVHRADTFMRDVICHIAYGESYQPLFRFERHRNDAVLLPENASLPDRSQAVLHLGDSMVYGMGVARDATFVAELNRLPRDTVHVNAGIPGSGPDGSLVTLRSWLSHHHFDLAVMYLFEGNDMRDIDSPFPCAAWKSLLTYSDNGVALRYSQPTPIEWTKPDWTWLRINSPPPYLVRAALPFSEAARQLAGALLTAAWKWTGMVNDEPDSVRFEHLEILLRAARDEARTHATEFAVVVFPNRRASDSDGGPIFAESIASRLPEIAARLGIAHFDAGEVLHQPAAQGADVYIGADDCHFNPAGHRLVARWLDTRIADLLDRQPKADHGNTKSRIESHDLEVTSRAGLIDNLNGFGVPEELNIRNAQSLEALADSILSD